MIAYGGPVLLDISAWGRALLDRLAADDRAGFDTSGPAALRLALEAQAELARMPDVSHRVKPVDLLVAAIAHEHALGVLHYDHDYDTIAERSGLRLRSVWIAARGSVPWSTLARLV